MVFRFASPIWHCPIQTARKKLWVPPQSAGEWASVWEQGCSQPHGDCSPSQEYHSTKQLRDWPYCHSPETKALLSHYPLNPSSHFLKGHGPFPFSPQVQNLGTSALLSSTSYLEISQEGYALGGHILGCPSALLPMGMWPFNGPCRSKPARMTADFFLHRRLSHSYGTICSIKQHLA